MKVVRLARFVGLALASVILVVSGLYVVIDLARWEWNRAMISALVFLSSLVVVVTMILYRQLRRVEQRLDDLERHSRRGDADATLGAMRAGTPPAGPGAFRWLDTPPDRLGVFVPALLGAGVLLSFFAYVVERVAGFFASSTLDRRTVRHLAPDLPLGGGMYDPWTFRAATPERHHPLAWLATVVVTVLVATLLVQGLRELTQSRPGQITTAGSTTVVVEIEQRRHLRPLDVVAADLWSSCRSSLIQTVAVTDLAVVGERTVRYELDRSLGHTGRARLTGCFEDYTLPLIRGDVVSLESFPADEG